MFSGLIFAILILAITNKVLLLIFNLVPFWKGRLKIKLVVVAVVVVVVVVVVMVAVVMVVVVVMVAVVMVVVVVMLAANKIKFFLQTLLSIARH